MSQAAENASVPTCCSRDLGGLEGRGHDHEPTLGVVEQRRGRRPGWWSCRRRRRPRSPADWASPARAATTRAARGRGASDAAEPAGVGHRVAAARAASRVDQVGLDGEHPFGGQAADVLGDVVAVQQRHAARRGLGRRGPRPARAGPGRSATTPTEAISRSTSPRMSAAFQADRSRAEPGQRRGRRRRRGRSGRSATPAADRAAGRGREAEVVQLVDPRGAELGTVCGDDLVGPGVGPRASVPGTAQPRPGLLAGVLGAPLGFVAVDVAADLRGAWR